MRGVLLAIVCGAFAVSLGARADAHAILVESVPAAAAEVDGPDVEVRLVFNSRIDVARSSLSLSGEKGGLGEPLALAAETKPNTLLSRATGLAPGPYHLRWQVLSIDGHVSRGDVPFRVRAR